MKKPQISSSSYYFLKRSQNRQLLVLEMVKINTHLIRQNRKLALLERELQLVKKENRNYEELIDEIVHLLQYVEKDSD